MKTALTNLMDKYPVLNQMMKYGLVGMINTGFGLGLIFSLMYFVQLNSYLSNFIGYACAVSISYILNRSWTFQSKASHVKAVALFICVVLVSYAVQFASLHILIINGINEYIAQIIAMGIYAASGFLGHKFISFGGDHDG